MPRTLIQNVRLFDGTGADPYQADILIEGGTFEAIGNGLSTDGAEVVAGGGRFALPGMIDCHVHVSLFGEEGLSTYARMGVTTVKDLGGLFDTVMDIRTRQRAGDVPGARMLSVGAFVDGDPAAFGDAGMGGTDVGMEKHGSDREIAATLERNLAAGVDGIKLYAGLPPDLVQTAIQLVGNRVPVTGHLTATTATEAAGMGIGGLEHCQLSLYRDLAPAEHALGPEDTMANPAYWGKVRAGWEAIDPTGDAAKGLVAALAEAGTVMDPTLVLGCRTDPTFTDEEDAAFTDAQRARMAARGSAVASGPAPVDLEPSADAMIRLIEQMHRGGVVVTPGTDCGAVGVPAGYGYHIELSLLAKAMPAREVLLNATAAAAKWLRRPDLGTVAAGKRADLVLLEADPLEDISNTRRIHAVFMDGTLVV